MKFNCGPTFLQKWEQKWEAQKTQKKYLSNWHPYFALLPRRLNKTNEWRWLETIERQGMYRLSWDGGYWDWEYRARKNK